jgi:hypothetical protein
LSTETAEAEVWPPPIKYQPWNQPADPEDILADPAVDEFGEHWQRWPILVEITEYRVIWAEGPNRKKAIESFDNDPEWYEREGVNDPTFYAEVNSREPRAWEMREATSRDYERREVYGPLREDGEL